MTLSTIPSRFVALTDRPGHAVFTHRVAREAGLTALAAEEYLRRLVRDGRLARRGTGVLTAARRGRWRLEPTSLLRRVSAAIGAELPMTPVVGWTTEWLAHYAHNVPFRHWTVLEAPSFTMPSLAEVLAQRGMKAVVDPAPDDMTDLLRLFERPLVLWPRAELYRTVSRGGLRLPDPERLVVDMYVAVTRQGLPYPENDLDLVIARFVTEGDLNIGTILSYARRRRIRPEFLGYLRRLDRLPDDVREAIEYLAARPPRRAARP